MTDFEDLETRVPSDPESATPFDTAAPDEAMQDAATPQAAKDAGTDQADATQDAATSQDLGAPEAAADAAGDARASSDKDAGVKAGAVATETAKDAGGDQASDATKSAEAGQAPADPRIPAVITTRTLFFLAPDLPPRRVPEPDDELRRSSNSAGGRRRRQPSGPSAAVGMSAPATPAAQPEPEAITEPQPVKGSTRLAAKRQRRRESRDLGRRRIAVTESEFQARREAVDRKMLVRAKDGTVQLGVLEDSILVEHYVARSEEVSLIGNVYLGRVQNVLPSMEAAFVDIGAARNAVLYSGEVDWAAAELGPNTPRKIENALKSGDKVLVQVTKDPVGHKGARLSSQISLPGRYLVFVPGNGLGGISRKLPETERTRLKKILQEIVPSDAGVIVRTAAEGATKEQLQRDIEWLQNLWADIQQRANGKAPQTLHAEPDMLIKIIRDVFNEDFQKLIIQGSEEYDTISTYLSQVAPDLLDRIERFTGDDIFEEYRVGEMIDRALGRKVWLPSGGSLVIDRTEAMTVIDVNTGKFVGSGGNLEETVTKNNLEAAEEIVRQLRLRDIGGIIVIDFIDMVLESNRDLVQRRLVEGLSRDRTKHQVTEVTSLGLIQMTRKKIGLGLLETFSEPCVVCGGRGAVVHSHPVDHGAAPVKGKPRRKPEPKPALNGTHEITQDARNALTKIAASTIVTALVPTDAPEEVSVEPAQRRSRRSRRAGRGRAQDAVAPLEESAVADSDIAAAPEPASPESAPTSPEPAERTPAEPKPSTAASKRKPRRRVSTGTVAADAIRAEAEPQQGPRQQDAQHPEPTVKSAAPAAQPAERASAQPTTKPKRRRVTTGTLHAE